MTVQSEVSRVSYSGDGSTTAFAVPFYFLANADLTVIVRDASDVETVQTLGTHYTLTGAGVAAGGEATFTTAPANGTTVVILREPAITQLTNYSANDPFAEDSHERALDKLTMIAQRHEETFSRAALLPKTSSYSDLAFPEPEDGKVIVWDGEALSNKLPVDLPVDAVGGEAGLAILADETVGDVISYLNVKALNADGGFTQDLSAATTNWLGPFGGTWVAGNRWSMDLTSTYGGSRAVAIFRMVSTGSGTNGPATADLALMISAEKRDWKTSLIQGEVDPLSVAFRQGKYGDASGLLINGKKVFDGALAYGFTGAEGALYWTDGTSDTTGIHYGVKFTLGQMINAGGSDVRDGGVGLSLGALVGDVASASPKSAFVARGDGAGGKWLRVLVASSSSLEADNYFQITGGSDGETPTMRFGKAASNSATLRNIAGTLQVINHAGDPILNLVQSTKTADLFGGLKVGGTSGVRLTAMLENTVNLDFGSIAAGGVLSLTATVTGVGSTDELTVTPITYASGSLSFVVNYETTDTVRVYCQNHSTAAVDPASQQLKIVARRYTA